MRTLSIALCAVLALSIVTPRPALAAEEKAPAAAAAPQPAAPADMKGMEGCADKPDGACCASASCQEAKAEAAAKGEAGGCPCQKAKQAAQAQK